MADSAGTIYITTDVGFSGAITTNQTDIAVYQTVAHVTAVDEALGGAA